MEIRRTYKAPSLRAGQTEVISEDKAREIFGQTEVAFHNSKTGYVCCKCPDTKPCTCGQRGCIYCAIPAMEKLMAGGVVETYFSRFEVVQ